MGVITKFVENENFHTTLINFIYQFKCKNEEIAALNLLSRLLYITNKKYPEIDLFAREKMNRYIMNFGIINQSINDIYFLNISLLIPSQNVIKEDYLEDALKFALETIYENNLNNEILFEREKRLAIEMVLNNYKNIDFIAEKNMLDLIDDAGFINKFKYRDIEYLNNLSLENIVDCFNKYIKNVKPKIFINGNIDKSKTELIITDYFEELNLKDYKVLKHYNYFYDNEEFIDKNDVSKFYQSIVYMVYNVKDYNQDDFYKLYFINLLLNNSSSDLLLKGLRKENNLVYSCGSSIMMRNGLLFIKATTNKNNIKLTKVIIDSIINEIRNGYIDNNTTSDIIHRLSLNIEREKDSFYVDSSNIINDFFKIDLSSEKVLNILKSIAIDELIEFANKLELKCIYTLEGNR